MGTRSIIAANGAEAAAGGGRGRSRAKAAAPARAVVPKPGKAARPMQPPPRPASPDKDEEELDQDLWQYEAEEEQLGLRATKKPRREAAEASRGVGGFISLAQMAGFKELLTETIKEALPAREAPLEFSAAKDPAIESVQTVLKKIADAPDQGKLGEGAGADLVLVQCEREACSLLGGEPRVVLRG